jgi:capsular exopolysaccharide synthesis family protein
MTRISPLPQIAAESATGFAGTRPEAPGPSVLDFDSLSWLVPKVPLRQVICILGAGQEPVREQFRLLRTRLEDARRVRPLKMVLVTSSLPEEGKSFVALNLAATISQRGRNKVLLLEADLRRPGCCSALELSPVAGLAECCASNHPVASFVYRISGLDLCLMPAGDRPAAETELLASHRMSQVLAETGRAFDWVLLDSPPLLPVADSVALSRRCDGIVLVVRRNKALNSAVREALNRIEPGKLLGIVLNDFPSRHGCQAYFQSAADMTRGKNLEVSDSREAA